MGWIRGAYSVVKVQVIRFVGAKGRRVEAVLAGILVAFLAAALPSILFQAGNPPCTGLSREIRSLGYGRGIEGEESYTRLCS